MESGGGRLSWGTGVLPSVDSKFLKRIKFNGHIGRTIRTVNSPQRHTALYKGTDSIFAPIQRTPLTVALASQAANGGNGGSIMFGGAKPPISSQGRGPKAGNGVGVWRIRQPAPPHQQGGAEERCKRGLGQSPGR